MTDPAPTAQRRVVRPARPSARAGQPRSAVVTLVALTVLLALAVLAGAAVLIASSSPATAVLGVVLAGLAVGGAAAAVLVLGHPRAGRLEVVAEPARLTFPAPAALPWVNRGLATLASLLIVPPGIALAQGTAGDLPLFGLATPTVVAALALPAAVRAWSGRARYSHLVLDPDGVRFVGARGERAARWDDVRRVQLRGARLHLSGADGSVLIDVGARDLASDARLLADVLDLYRRRPALRGEIGEAALPRLERGDLA
ncbi:PH domain-containing protein [Litorihabitans aurantiacus]|uniref:PH domain-containing protein n=1 Tax=Litorihabitans aurantiacus TaxID=1930061 RepID=UPI0024E0EA80|nr:PH domain-containing protein [Litorihabitans aurantiacus]